LPCKIPHALSWLVSSPGKLGGGILSTVLIFLIVYALLGHC